MLVVVTSYAKRRRFAEASASMLLVRIVVSLLSVSCSVDVCRLFGSLVHFVMCVVEGGEYATIGVVL